MTRCAKCNGTGMQFYCENFRECPHCGGEGIALAAAASGGDVEQAPGEAPQSGGCKPQRPETSMTTLSSHKYSMKEDLK